MIIKKFEEQVEKFPGRNAVITDKIRLTYGELNRYSNRLANTITGIDRGSGKKAENRQNTALLFEHSADMIIGVLGALKAGKVYVPLDVTYPENRLIYMLEHSESYLVITNRRNRALAERLTAALKTPPVIVDIDAIVTDTALSSENLQREWSGEKLAYILYTSGSTGRPKGVVQDHRNVCYYIRNWTERFSITHEDRVTLFSAFSHDGAGQDMFGALHNGAALYPFNILSRPNIAEISAWLKEEKITIWHSVPTLYRYFLNTLSEDDTGSFTGLRYILLGGEAIRDHDIQMYRRYFPQTTLANVYGQTESSVSTIWQIKPGEVVEHMLIGDPLDETKILIINEEDEIVEDLGVGEIVIACDHIALGYWKDKETTGKVFSHDPELGKLYSTGDLGCLMADGRIEFMGRKDTQVKIRGFRVEMGEIETRLLNHPAVKEAVVIPREDEDHMVHLCAYIVPAPVSDSTGKSLPPAFTVSDMRAYLTRDLPEYMVPTHLVTLEKFPQTPSGKIDRKGLPEPEHLRPRLKVTYIEPGTSLEKEISKIWTEVLSLDKVGINDNFFDLGGTSFDILNIMRKIYETFRKDVPVVAMFRYPTIRSLAAYLNQEETGSPDLLDREKDRERARASQIAVIGMAGKFPGARNIDEFWENLKNGRETITFFTDDQLTEASGLDPFREDPSFVKAKGIMNNIEYFDAAFFNYSPKEARVMDPQLRMLHECTWEALENAGYDPDTYEGLIGLFAGNAMNQYWMTMIFLNRISTADMGFLINNYSTIVSYKLNLHGPSVVVQSACSTALVAVHLGCQALIDYDCDIALSGAVSIILPEKKGYLYEEGMILSRDGHCRPFDSRASGTVFCDGVGIVALKRLEEAIADGDHIYAVIKGSGINNDGRRKVGLASPSVEGQAELIGRVLANTGIEPESISYIEAHGTGTILGDPVELEALRLGLNTEKRGCIRIGSVKGNVGHLNTAAAVAGFIKTLLIIRHRVIPPSLHFETPNPKFDFENSPFVVNTQLTEWKRSGYPLRAAVSAFGIGGTNAHVILEEPPVLEASSQSRANQLILLSAVSEPALGELAGNLAAYLEKNPGIDLADVAYTLQVGRRACSLRKMILSPGIDDAIQQLEAYRGKLPGTGPAQNVLADDGSLPVVFMFPGQGSQYVNMGLDLYRQEPDFALEMQGCFEILKGLPGNDLKEVLYPRSDRSDRPDPSDIDRSDPSGIDRTEITQPVIFILEYCMARLLMKWGLQPFAMIGHSIGEYVAACLAGVFTLEDALKLVVLRGKLMQRMPGGAMLSVPLPEKELAPLLQKADTGIKGSLSLAAVNSTAHCVVSGPNESIELFRERLKEAYPQLEFRRLHTSHAYHSAMMDPILEEFAEVAGGITLNKPQIPYISNVSGKWISVEEAVDPSYWAKHIRSTVRFSDGLDLLLAEPNAIFLEVGPGRALSTFVRQHKDKKPTQPILNLLRHPNEKVSDSVHLLDKIGRLWLNGKKIDWKGYYFHEKRNRLSLPSYPFQRQYYWLKGSLEDITSRLEQGTPAPKLGKRSDIAEWLYIPSWKGSAVPLLEPPAGREKETEKVTETFNWLVFTGGCSIGTLLVEKLKQQGHRVITVKTGTGFDGKGEDEYTLNPSRLEEYGILLQECRARESVPQRIVHLWEVTGEDVPPAAAKPQPGPDREQERGFYSLLNLAQAIGNQGLTGEIQLTVLTHRMQAVWGEDLRYPQKATVIGPVLSIPQEYPNIKCRSIDIVIPEPGTPAEEKLSGLLLQEISTPIDDPIIAYRENARWVKTYEPHPLEKAGEEIPRLREAGVYLVTGGLGGIGLVLSRFLAQKVKARLILTGRSAIPPREEWGRWLENHEESDRTGEKIRKILRLEELGSRVLLINADVADRQQMQRALEQAEGQWGKINGVIHSAGTADGGLIGLRTKEMSRQVMASKVIGTLVLDELLKGRELDFFILCSSISAVKPPLGQVAYCAANNFLDHFAHYKTFRDGTFTVSINWGAWQEVGMAVEAARQLAGPPQGPKPPVKTVPVDYPFLERCEIMDPGKKRVVYTAKLQADKCWYLDEHRINGKPTLPGTAYLELTRAAFEHLTENRGTPEEAGKKKENVELSEFYSLIPLVVEENQEKEMRIIFKKEEKGYGFSFVSRVKPGEDRWLEHARGKAVLAGNEEPRRLALEEIRQRCREKEITYNAADFVSAPGAITFGPRWNSLRQAHYGANQVLARLELPGEFAADVELYKLHPAILDVGSPVLKKVEREIRNEAGAAYLPIHYKRLRIKGDLPTRVLFHVTPAGENKPNAEILGYNVVITDEQGTELVEIESYTLKMVKTGSQGVDRLSDQGAEALPNPGPGDLAHPWSDYIGQERAAGQKSVQAAQNELLKDAILPDEGVEVFTRVLNGKRYSQVVVSTTDLQLRFRKPEKTPGPGTPETAVEATTTENRLSRPTLSTTYAEPQTKTEKIIVEVWQEQLGVEPVGIDDDFFELGGDSLKAITMTGKIHKTTQKEVPLAEFFNYPTVRKLARYIAGKEVQDILQPVRPVEKKDYYELSPAQERLYVLYRVAPQDTAYNLSRAIRFEEDIDLEKVEGIIKKIIQRHESLRTSFMVVGGQPVQGVREQVEFKIDFHDLTAGGGSKDEILSRFVRPFDLGKAPLLRVEFIKEANKKYVMAIDFHHIVTDAHSLMVIFLREYRALSRGDVLPPLRIQYKDFTGWQNRQVSSPAVRKHEEFWLEEFKDGVPALELPLDHERPAAESYRGDWLISRVKGDQTRAFRTLLLEEDATLFMGLLAVYNILLFKLSGQEDIVVGTTTSGRNHPDLLPVMGMFVNMLAIRNFPAGEKTFSQFLKEVKEKVLNVLAHQDYQFEELVEKVGVERRPGRNPLFDVVLSMQNVAERSGIGGEAHDDGDYLAVKTGASKFDLGLEILEINDVLQCKLEYKTSLFKPGTIARYAGYFGEILAAVLKDKNICLQDIQVTHDLLDLEVKIPEIDFKF